MKKHQEKKKTEKSKKAEEDKRKRMEEKRKKLFSSINQPASKDVSNMESLFETGLSESLACLVKDGPRKALSVQKNILNSPKIKSPEEEEELLQEDIWKKERARELQKYRYENRKDDSEFIKKILDLKLFTKPPLKEEEIPVKFPNFEKYYSVWEPLFEYEVYSQLINMKKEGNKSKLTDV